ncbi:MAG: NADH-quinone oxidoreductase subunit A [Candidatus Hinthialibacter antarcticus]|nr:NADH-quinone oxidoreductase subunit A [Candidatus Hinthialibacter antarcticus]
MDNASQLPMAAHLLGAFVFILFAVFSVFAGVFIAKVIAPRNPYPDKQLNYECGERPVGSPWIRFNIRFYIIALLFIVFDVEVLFLIPWAVEYRNLLASMGALAFWEMFVFLFILGIGLAYCWVKGHLEWVLTSRTVSERV